MGFGTHCPKEKDIRGIAAGRREMTLSSMDSLYAMGKVRIVASRSSAGKVCKK